MKPLQIFKLLCEVPQYLKTILAYAPFCSLLAFFFPTNEVIHFAGDVFQVLGLLNALGIKPNPQKPKSVFVERLHEHETMHSLPPPNADISRNGISPPI